MWKTATVIIAIVLILATFGLVMLASTSSAKAESEYHDPYYYVKKQSIWLIVSLVAGFFTARVIDYRYLKRFAPLISLVSVLLLIAVFIPGIGISVKGSQRWLYLVGMRFQPSELAKLSVILILAWWFSREQRSAGQWFKGFVLPSLFLGVYLVLILIEPDFGTTMLIGCVGGFLLFVGGTQVSYLILGGMMGFLGLAFLIMRDEERMRRILAFLEPEAYARGEAFQLMQSIYAFIAGGALGKGFGQSIQKHHYLPEAHTDFIFAIIGEELGFIASLSVVLLFMVFFGACVLVGLRSRDRFGRYVSFGVGMMIALQSIINIGVVTGCLPTKGLALPFISYGGSSLLFSMLMVGIVVNIAMNNEPIQHAHKKSSSRRAFPV